jgi:DOMON domain-containing protein
VKRLIVALTVLVLSAAGVFAGGEGESKESSMGSAMSEVEMMEGYSSAAAAGVTVQWKIDGSNLSVQMSAATTGWIAVGFDPSRQMADANIIIGYVSDGTVFLRDDFGTGNVRHGADVENGGTDNLTAVEGEESNGMTAISFTIPLDSGDSMDKPLAAGSTYKVIVAHGPNDADDFGTYHGSRGSFEAKL